MQNLVSYLVGAERRIFMYGWVFLQDSVILCGSACVFLRVSFCTGKASKAFFSAQEGVPDRNEMEGAQKGVPGKFSFVSCLDCAIGVLF